MALHSKFLGELIKPNPVITKAEKDNVAVIKFKITVVF